MRYKEYCNKILDTLDNEAFYTDEMTKRGLKFNRHGNELKGACPFPELHASGVDSNPSFTVNLAKGTYYCNACSSRGNALTFYSKMYNVSKQDAWFALGDALGIERPTSVDTRPAIDPGLPVAYHAALKRYTGPLLDILKVRRGLPDNAYSMFCLGWNGDRVSIPIYDEHLELVNIRLYKWNSIDDASKMINYSDELGNTYGEDRIFGIEHLYNDDITDILWCEGEWDRIIAESVWNIPTCTMTAGASNFKYEWYQLLKRKKCIYLAYDNDTAGEQAAQERIQHLCKHVEVYVLKWPKRMPNKYDLTDLHTKEHFTRAQLFELFVKVEEDTTTPLVQLAQSTLAQYTGKRLRVPALVAGKITTPYIVPCKLHAECNIGSSENKLCATCKLLTTKRSDVTLTSKDPSMLLLINCPQEKQSAVIRRLLGVSQKCLCPDLTYSSYENIETIQLVPKADTAFGFGGGANYCTRVAYVLAEEVRANKRYTFAGYMHADPNTQQATHIFDDCTPEKDLLEEFEMTPELLEGLKIFQPAEGQTVSDKMNDIHRDLERNVTYVWERRNVAIAADLVYHSVLNFTFQEQPVKRGWCECLIIGDSGQAKTTLVEQLMKHYGLGELLSGETTKRTGLVYNIKQAGDAWMLNWGAMPLNDGGLLTIDELSGMPAEDLSKMSDVRSSGIAKASGVVTGETMARTRLIFISNPRSGRQLNAEVYGVNAVLKLIGAAEDVRRLDFAVGVASGEVDANLVNKAVADFPTVEHKYTSELCRQLVLWAWSRKSENVSFTQDAVMAILNYATKMGTKYSSRIPLVEGADQRIKLARLSVAVACRTFSTTDGINVLVTTEHVDFVYAYLNSVYDAKALSYNKFSEADFENSDTTDAAMQRLRQTFLGIPIASRTITEVAAAICQLNQRCTRNAIADTTGLDADELRLLLPFLIQNSLLEPASDGSAYYKTAVGREFFEGLLLQAPSNEEITQARVNRQRGLEI